MELTRKLTRRELLRGAALTVAAGALSGCASLFKHPTPTPTPPPAQEKAKLIYARPAGQEFDLLGKAALSFNDTGLAPDVEVEDVALEGDPFARIIEMEASGEPADVHLLTDETVPVWARQGYILSLDPFLADDTRFDLADFYEQFLANSRFNGQLWALPWVCTPYFLFVNKDLFQAAGVSLPASSWTWEDYKVAAIHLTNPEKNQWGGAPIDTFWQMGEHIWQNGGEVFNPDRTKCLLDQPEATDALQFWADLALADKAIPDATAKLGGSYRLFRSGQLAMYEDALYMVQSWKDVPFKWTLAPAPQNRKAANLLLAGSQVISAHTRHTAAAWQLLKYVTGPEVLRTFSAALRVPCARKSVNEKKPYIDPNIDIDWDLVQTGVQNGQLTEVTPNTGEVSSLLESLLKSIMEGTQTIREAIDKTVPQINDLIIEGWPQPTPTNEG